MVLQDIIRKKKLFRVGEVLDTDIMRIVGIRKTQILRFCVFCAADMRLGEVKTSRRRGKEIMAISPVKGGSRKASGLSPPLFRQIEGTSGKQKTSRSSQDFDAWNAALMAQR